MKQVYYWASIALVMCIYSCSLSPEDYEKEIQDAVKFHIAGADYIIELAQNPLFLVGAVFSSNSLEEWFGELETEFNELYINGDLTYQQVLERVSKNDRSRFQKNAEEILKHYKALRISLSDYTKSSTRDDYECWKFREQHSNIEFLFEFEYLDTGNFIWSCSPIEKSYEKYISDHVE
ncbi:hypothetical protein [Butyricimonas sp. Marseille-P3923]|uniref:hypothetical protein n=1 Tax=Butyricimonas sp. Marseille-P3923 TaxID=1987504 RepID=UPI000C07E048|nr:hypothetical protein [Butyricimonas sp. Marseille-P3923]